MISEDEFRARIDRSIADSVCVLCGAKVGPPSTTAILAIGEHADVAVRMCDDCLRDYLEWRAADQRKGRLS